MVENKKRFNYIYLKPRAFPKSSAYLNNTGSFRGLVPSNLVQCASRRPSRGMPYSITWLIYCGKKLFWKIIVQSRIPDVVPKPLFFPHLRNRIPQCRQVGLRQLRRCLRRPISWTSYSPRLNEKHRLYVVAVIFLIILTVNDEVNRSFTRTSKSVG